MEEEHMSRILIIDDNDEERTILQTEFNEAGYQTITATNGEEGIVMA